MRTDKEHTLPVLTFVCSRFDPGTTGSEPVVTVVRSLEGRCWEE